jgi:hypothetical protein
MKPNICFFAGAPGDLYCPTNGEEGWAFDSVWCERCQKDVVWREEQDDGTGCPIIVDALCDRNPPEWVYGSDGQPCCTAFVEIGTPLKPEQADPNQMELPI